MSLLRRHLDWNSAVRDIRADRAVLSFLRADGGFDLSAIMRNATARARRTRANVGGRLSWQACMRLELRAVWAEAKRQRATFTPRPAPVMRPVVAFPFHPLAARTAHAGRALT